MRIHPRLTKFSSAYTKGSLAQRFALTDKINQKIFGNTVKLYPDKKRNYPAEVIEECYNFCTPEDKNVLIKPLKISKDDDYAGGTNIMRKMDMYVGYFMELPVTKNEKINIRTLPTLMHESTHVLDFLLNPKFLKNDLDFFNKPLSEKCFDFYEKIFYKLSDKPLLPAQILETAQKEIEEFLETLPVDMKIKFLNFMRYSMRMEEHAYRQDIHYAKILKKLGKPVDSEELTDYNKVLLFPQKIKIVENLLAKTLKEERLKLKPPTLIEQLKNIFTSKSTANV